MYRNFQNHVQDLLRLDYRANDPLEDLEKESDSENDSEKESDFEMNTVVCMGIDFDMENNLQKRNNF